MTLLHVSLILANACSMINGFNKYLLHVNVSVFPLLTTHQWKSKYRKWCITKTRCFNHRLPRKLGPSSCVLTKPREGSEISEHAFISWTDGAHLGFTLSSSVHHIVFYYRILWQRETAFAYYSILFLGGLFTFLPLICWLEYLSVFFSKVWCF